LKVLILARHLSRGLGGIEIQCDLIARMLTSQGHSVLYGAAGGHEAGGHRSYPIADWSVGDRLALERLIEGFRPDIVYLRHNKRSFRATARVASRKGATVVFAASSLQDVRKWAYHRSNGPLGPRRLASIAWQCVKSRWNWTGFRWVAGAVSLNSEYTDRLPIGLRVHIPDSMETDSDPFVWPRPFVAWVAQLKDYKHPEDYVELARRCADTNIDFLMAGGIISSRYRWIADRQATPPNFHYLGELTPRAVNGLLRTSLALVHTCDPEGFGNNFIQAWQQGKPSLSLRFDPGGTITRFGLGTVPGSLDGLEHDLRALLADESWRRTIGDNALAHSREYDPEVNVRRLSEFFLHVLTAEGKA
jgi:glycosyltransferase involved in cell wall biosynthesis